RLLVGEGRGVDGSARHRLTLGGRVLRRGAPLGDLIEVELVLDDLPDAAGGAAQVPQPLAHGPRHLRKPLRPQDQEGHHQDDQDFTERQAEHGRAVYTKGSGGPFPTARGGSLILRGSAPQSRLPPSRLGIPPGPTYLRTWPWRARSSFRTIAASRTRRPTITRRAHAGSARSSTRSRRAPFPARRGPPRAPPRARNSSSYIVRPSSIGSSNSGGAPPGSTTTPGSRPGAWTPPCSRPAPPSRRRARSARAARKTPSPSCGHRATTPSPIAPWASASSTTQRSRRRRRALSSVGSGSFW